MRDPEQETPKSSRLKIVIIILAVLLVLSAGGLAARYVYLHFFASTQSTATVPDNLIRGEDAESEDTSEDGSGQSDDDHSMGDSDSPDGEDKETVDGDKQAGGTSDSPDGKNEETAGADKQTGGTSDNPDGTDDPGTDRPAAEVLELYEGKPGDNRRFEVKNMFPGDTMTKYFCIRTYHGADLELFLKTEVTSQTKNLGDVLRLKITHMENGKVLCDAPFSEVNGSEFFEVLKKNQEKATTAYYQIDVSLDTSVGNAYQMSELKADFQWYVKDEGGLTPPKTGDTMHLILWMTLAVSSALLISFLLYERRQKASSNNRRKSPTTKKLTASVTAVIVLAASLSITTFALVYSMVAVEDNFFQTGKIKINLNNGKPVIGADAFLFEPGMTVEKDFFIENQSTWDVYYKLYFDHVEGGLADELDIAIRDGDTVLYSGKASKLQKSEVRLADDVLKVNERRELTIVFHYPETGGNSGQNQYLTFDLKADAVQTKNNPRKLGEFR